MSLMMASVIKIKQPYCLVTACGTGLTAGSAYPTNLVICQEFGVALMLPVRSCCQVLLAFKYDYVHYLSATGV